MGQQPWIVMEGQMGTSIRLDCRSEGWYPEPPILWVNGDGVNMMAQQETTYQPDDQGLFIVSSSIEISKHSLNKYTCLINNVILKESREAHIQIAAKKKKATEAKKKKATEEVTDPNVMIALN
ncbi:butyrophilin subfamily 1 member A1-like [Chiloscyllium punctatum]|uniref:butyrophilin subfamily 1 member A1-like n=1 Tax=Chiloscyllium punctatum TaxID=137246 RepID=UPI003B63FA15